MHETVKSLGYRTLYNRCKSLTAIEIIDHFHDFICILRPYNRQKVLSKYVFSLNTSSLVSSDEYNNIMKLSQPETFIVRANNDHKLSNERNKTIMAPITILVLGMG